MAGAHSRFLWRAMPLVGLVLAFAASELGGLAQQSSVLGVALPSISLAVLIGVVFAAVYHADVIAHRTGEPYGTLVLTVAVTVIEVALILSIMLSGEGRPGLARETVFAVIMVVCNGVVGLCLILGVLRYGEQGFRLPGTSAYLVVLMPLATLTLILPTYTISAAGPYYTDAQLGFVSLVTLALYGTFLYVQTVRHRDYFLSDLGGAADEHAAPPTTAQLWESVALLPIGAYFPDSYRAVHTNPEEAVRGFVETGARVMVPMHYGTFKLGREPMDEPVRRLTVAAGRDADRIVLRQIGSAWTLPQKPPHSMAADARAD